MNKKKIRASAAVMAVMLGMTSQPAVPVLSAETRTYYYADMDGNEVLDAYDLVLMRQGLVAPDKLTDIQKAIFDTSANGAMDGEDISLLQEFLLGNIEEFPSGPVYTVTDTPPEPVYNGQKMLSSGRYVEKLDRGTYAVSTGKEVFVSWRLMAQDEPDIGFNLYRTTGGATVKLNDAPLTGGTNFTDKTADLSKDNTYYVTTVYNGVETPTDGSYTLTADAPAGAEVIPIQPGGTIHFVWVGDFNGDGKYDYLVDRPNDDHQKLEAYLNDGTYLWTMDMGYNSEDKYQIEPGASALDLGMWDGATVYDIDMDGYAEVMVRIADGVTFGDGKVFTHKNHANYQEIAVLDGMTGSMKASAPVPNSWLDEGPMACMMEIGYLDGKTPSLLCWMKNRNNDKSFNSINVAYGYGGGTEFRQQWIGGCYGAEAHQFRVEDVDFDGKDELLHIGYALNSDGSKRYTMPDVIHGDRYHIAPFSNGDNGKVMMGYGVQQRNPSGLLEYTYNASTGELIWKNIGGDGDTDIGRGDIGDIDPTHVGYEVWSFQGIYTMKGEKLSDTSAYPAIKLYWDGDLLSESYNDTKIEKWNYDSQTVSRVATTWKIYGSYSSERGAPLFYGDILGDWREEIICAGYDSDCLVIYSTPIPTDYRFNTLSQDPAYRNDMTSKGYVQSNMLSYYMGEGMDMPEQPDVRYIGEAVLDEQAVYAIRNVNSGRIMDVAKSERADGTNVQQYGTSAGKSNNTWTVRSAGDGCYYIISRLSTGENCYLTVAGGADENGTNLEISTFSGSDSQKFRLKSQPGGSFMLMTECSGGSKCVEVADAETGAGANVRQWVPTGSTCQWWSFEKVQ